MSDIPTDFDPFPVDFVVGLLVPSIVFFSVMILLLFIVIPITCCNVTLTTTTQRYMSWAFALAATVSWALALFGISRGYLDETLDLADKVFDTAKTVNTNINTALTCFNNETVPLDLSVILEIEAEFDKYSGDVEKWHGVATSSLIASYSLLIGITITYLFINDRLIKKIIIGVSALILFIVFLIMIPVSNVGYSAVGFICGDDIGQHNTNIKELIANFDDSVTVETFCDDDTWKYLCDVQTCSDGDSLLSDVFNTTLLEEANTNGMLSALGPSCNYEVLLEMIENTLDDTLGCTKIKGYYTTMVDVILCNDLQQVFSFTLWPVGLGTIFTVGLLTVGLVSVVDYSVVPAN